MSAFNSARSAAADNLLSLLPVALSVIVVVVVTAATTPAPLGMVGVVASTARFAALTVPATAPAADNFDLGTARGIVLVVLRVARRRSPPLPPLPVSSVIALARAAAVPEIGVFMSTPLPAGALPARAGVEGAVTALSAAVPVAVETVASVLCRLSGEGFVSVVVTDAAAAAAADPAVAVAAVTELVVAVFGFGFAFAFAFAASAAVGGAILLISSIDTSGAVGLAAFCTKSAFSFGLRLEA